MHLWKIIINDHLDAFEVYASRHEIRTNQHPNISPTKPFDDLLSLLLRALGVHDIHVQSIKHQLAEEVLRTVFAL
jgi:hypothetical protein